MTKVLFVEGKTPREEYCENPTKQLSHLKTFFLVPTQTDDSNFPRRGVVWAQVDTRHKQQTVISVELGELGVAPVELPHTGTVHQRDITIWTLRIPQLHTTRQKTVLKRSEWMMRMIAAGSYTFFNHLFCISPVQVATFETKNEKQKR